MISNKAKITRISSRSATTRCAPKKSQISQKEDLLTMLSILDIIHNEKTNDKSNNDNIYQFVVSFFGQLIVIVSDVTPAGNSKLVHVACRSLAWLVALST